MPLKALNPSKTRPVWTGFKIAVRHKLLTHYKKAKVLVGGWVGGWMDGWMGGKAGLSIAYSNQKQTNMCSHCNWT